MRDELMPGAEVAAYWIEHVLRHGGTKHLQLSGKDMPFYQRYLLDVFAFLLLLLVSVTFFIYNLICFIMSGCYRFLKPRSNKRKIN